VIKLLATRAQADFDVGQTLSESHLSKAHGKELLPAEKLPHFVVTLVTSHTTTELFGVDPFDDLVENRLAEMHERIVGKKNLKENALENDRRVEIAHTSFSAYLPRLKHVPPNFATLLKPDDQWSHTH